MAQCRWPDGSRKPDMRSRPDDCRVCRDRAALLRVAQQDFIGARIMWRSSAPRTIGDCYRVAQYAYSEYYAPAWPVAQNSAELTALLRPGGRAFLLYTLPVELRAFHRDLLETVDADFDTVRFPGNTGRRDVYVCRERSRHGSRQP